MRSRCRPTVAGRTENVRLAQQSVRPPRRERVTTLAPSPRIPEYRGPQRKHATHTPAQHTATVKGWRPSHVLWTVPATVPLMTMLPPPPLIEHVAVPDVEAFEALTEYTTAPLSVTVMCNAVGTSTAA